MRIVIFLLGLDFGPLLGSDRIIKITFSGHKKGVSFKPPFRSATPSGKLPMEKIRKGESQKREDAVRETVGGRDDVLWLWSPT